MELAHLGVAGEEAEGAAAGDFEDAADFFGGLREEVGVAGCGHVGREVEQRLLGVVEVAGDDELFGERDAEAFLEVVEAGRAVGVGDGEGGGGEDDAGVVGEEGFGEEGGDVDGRGLEVGGEGEAGLRRLRLRGRRCGGCWWRGVRSRRRCWGRWIRAGISGGCGCRRRACGGRRLLRLRGGVRARLRGAARALVAPM